MGTIYGLFDPRTDELRYVGLHENDRLQVRLSKHLSRARADSSTRHSLNWMRQLMRYGMKPRIRSIQVVEGFENLKAAEKYWIAHLKSLGCRLTNSTDGGEGLVNPSLEVREKIAASKRGKPRPASVGIRVAEASRGRRVSEETRERMSQSQTGRVQSQETRLKISQSRKGIRFSDEHRARLSAAAKNRNRGA